MAGPDFLEEFGKFLPPKKDCPEPRSRAEDSGTGTQSRALLSVPHPIRYTKAKIRNKKRRTKLR